MAHHHHSTNSSPCTEAPAGGSSGADHHADHHAAAHAAHAAHVVAAALAATPAAKADAKAAKDADKADKADVKTALPDTAEAECDNCPVCLEELSAKREVTITPCGHAMHRTCIINWMETRCCEACHACPMCRASITELQGEDAPSQRVRAYGDHGQPTKRSVWRSSGIETNAQLLPFLDKAEGEIDATIRELSSSLAQFVDHRNCGCRDNDDYAQDIHDELAKLRRRAEIYSEMRRAFSEGGMRWWQINMRTVDTKPWSYEAEMEDLEETRKEEEEEFERAQRAQRDSPLIRFAEVVVVNQPLHQAVIMHGANADGEEQPQRPASPVPEDDAAPAASARDQRAAARDARREAREEREEE